MQAQAISVKSALVLAACLLAACLAIAKSAATDKPTPTATTNKPTTTSVAPKTSTTTAAPSTTPAPKATCEPTKDRPTPEAQKFVVQPNCIVAVFAALVKLDDGSYLNLGQGKVNNDKCVCDKSDDKSVNPKLVISYECGEIELEISQSDGKDFVKSINGQYKIVKDSKTIERTYSKTEQLFTVSDNEHYYKCNESQTVEFDDNSTAKISILFDTIAYEAYRDQHNGPNFYKSEQDCAISSSHRFGFIVYAIAIVVVVLVAYFVVRLVRRNQY